MKLFPLITAEHVRDALESDYGRYTTLVLAFGEISRAVHLAMLRHGANLPEVPRSQQASLLASLADGTCGALRHHDNGRDDVSRLTAWRNLMEVCGIVSGHKDLFLDTLCRVHEPHPLRSVLADGVKRMLTEWVTPVPPTPVPAELEPEGTRCVEPYCPGDCADDRDCRDARLRHQQGINKLG